MSPGQDTADRAYLAAAISIMIAGLFFAALNGAIMKGLTGSLPALMIVWGRYTGYLVFMLPISLYQHGLATFSPPRPGLQLIRIVLLLSGTLLFVSGVAKVAYADAIAIIYVYPFVLTALSPVFLGESVSRPVWFGVVAGFVGVLIVMRPEFTGASAHVFMVLGCGILLGVHLMLTRMLVRAVSPVITSTYTAFVVVLVTSAALALVWQPLEIWQIGMLALLGFVSAISQWLLLIAFSRAPAPDLAPFSYAEIPAAVLIGLVAFGELPDTIALIGIAVIIASGVFVARAPRVAAALERKRPPGI